MHIKSWQHCTINVTNYSLNLREPVYAAEEKKSVGRLTPEFIVVGTAARLSAAVPSFTQVTWIVHPRTVLGADNRPATRTPLMLHHLVDRTQHHTSPQ